MRIVIDPSESDRFKAQEGAIVLPVKKEELGSVFWSNHTEAQLSWDVPGPERETLKFQNMFNTNMLTTFMQQMSVSHVYLCGGDVMPPDGGRADRFSHL